jgi:2-amino-4-hydroxy-6-hydroxymethyldihydropteridine diphosphokinase
MMNRVFLGLGSDLGDREANIKYAVKSLEEQVGKIAAVSPVYETEPVGFTGSGDFLNMVISVETILSPSDILRIALALESEMGRTRGKTRNISRIIDIDILLYSNEMINSGALTIPHPRMHERKFVLVPLNDISPGLVHPILGKTVKELLSECKDKSRIRQFTS